MVLGDSFFLVAGKDGTCTRHMRGEASDLEGMLFGMAKRNKPVAAILKNVASDLKSAK